MSSARDAIRRLRELDDEISSVTEAEQTDPRIRFEYEIGPSRKHDGTEWYPVTLRISPLAGFDLAKVEKVVYVLHPTFTPSTVAVDNPANGFTLQFEAWGGFHAMAIAVMKDSGETVRLVRYLPAGE